jgi:hypothetical protein
MIQKWKMLPINTEGMQNRYVIYLAGDERDIKELARAFSMICQDPFEINQDGFNWAFYILNSTEYEREQVVNFLEKKGAVTEQDGSEEKTEPKEGNLKALVDEVKKVIQDLDKKGLTVEELKSIEEKTVQQHEVKQKEPPQEVKPEAEIKITHHIKSGEYKPDEIAIGYLYPAEEEQKFNIFMNTLAEIEKVTSKKPVGLRKVFAEAYNPFDESFKFGAIIKMFKNYRIETLVILSPNARMISKEKEVTEELKRKLKRKALFKIVPLASISKRSVYIGLIVDIALFKEKGLEYFRIKI